MYNHDQYGDMLANALVDIKYSLHASSQADPASVDEQISKLAGGVLVSVDGKDGEISYSGAESLNLGGQYTFLVLFPTVTGNEQSVLSALNKAKALAKEIIKKMMLDYEAGSSLLSELDPTSFEVHGIGPLGDCHHGVALFFVVGENFGFGLNPAMWKA